MFGLHHSPSLRGGAATFSSSETSKGAIFNTLDSVFSTSGSISRNATVGLVARGVTGYVFDLALYSANGTALLTNPTGTTNIGFNGGLVTFSNGIKFGTGDTLDAYEEGTWNSATIGGSGTFGTFTGSINGAYIRIGRQVTINVYFSGFTLTGATGNFRIGSLPFNPTGTGGAGFAMGSVMMHSIPFTGDYVNCAFSQYSGSTQIELFATRDSNSWVEVPVLNGGTKYLSLSLTYKI